MDVSPTLDRDTPGLGGRIETMTEAEINSLPFGVIRLDASGDVLLYSDVARQNSGFRKEAISRSYFTKIAPCMDNERFRSRIERAMASGSLDIAFDFTSDLPSGARDVDMHVRIQSANGGGCWIFVWLLD